jgi:hypothetical protein
MQLIHPVSQIDADPKQNIKNSKKWIYLNLSLAKINTILTLFYPYFTFYFIPIEKLFYF